MTDTREVHVSSTPDQILIQLRSCHDFRSHICILNQELFQRAPFLVYWMGADTVEQCVSTSCNMERFLALSTYVSPRQDAHNSRWAQLRFHDSRLLGSSYKQCMWQRI